MDFLCLVVRLERLATKGFLLSSATAAAESNVTRSSQQDDNMMNSQEGRLTPKTRQVMSPNQAIPMVNQEVDTFSVPSLPFSQAQRNEIFSGTSSRVYRELCGPEGVVLQQNNILQQVIQGATTLLFMAEYQNSKKISVR